MNPLNSAALRRRSARAPQRALGLCLVAMLLGPMQAFAQPVAAPPPLQASGGNAGGGDVCVHRALPVTGFPSDAAPARPCGKRDTARRI